MSELKLQSQANIPTDHGIFEMRAYAHSGKEKMPHLALVHPDTDMTQVIDVRIHSECMTGDVFGSRRCECGEQLQASMSIIGEQGGVLVYLRQEGRGIGLIEKLHAYVKQDEGYDTAEANSVLGHNIDARSYEDALTILMDIGVKRIRLLTNNPDKVSAFDQSTIEVVERSPLEITPKTENLKYLETKKHTFGHLLSEV